MTNQNFDLRPQLELRRPDSHNQEFGLDAATLPDPLDYIASETAILILDAALDEGAAPWQATAIFVGPDAVYAVDMPLDAPPEEPETSVSPPTYNPYSAGISTAAVSYANGYAIRTLQSTGADSNRVDIVFLGDGYTAGELNTTYAAHVQSMFNYLTVGGGALTDPFGRYRNFFNVYAVDVVSNQSGADDPVNGLVRDTALDASYNFDGVTDRLLYISSTKANAVINTALSGTGIRADMRFVTVNSAKYGGGGGTYAVYAGGNGSALEVAVHEVGHSYARLADHYTYGGPATYTGAEPTQPDVTLDSTGAKWSRWLGYNQPGIGVIGAYQGARYSQFGIYRPSVNSKMNSLNNPFDAVGQEQFILQFYSRVRPLDAYTSNAATLVDPNAVSVTVVDPNVISVRWSIDSDVIADGSTTTIDPGAYNLASGAHVVSAFAYDPTTLVRADRALLQQQVTWNVNLAHAVLRASATNHVLTGGALFDQFIGAAGLDTANYSISSTTATLTRHLDGTISINSAGAGQDSLSDMEFAQFADKKVWIGAQRNDGNNDGRSDILWRNVNGEAAYWQMNGASILAGSAVIGAAGANARLVGGGDFNQDRKGDLLWQDANGQVFEWLMNGTAISQNVAVANPGVAWRAIGAGDIDGDGKSDIVLQHTDGSVAIWLINGGAIAGAAIVAQNPGATWHVNGVADFDADGKSELLFQNDNGSVAIWKMNATAIASGAVLAANPGPQWHIRGTGDFNNDAKADIVWQHDNGDAAVWAMQDATTYLTGPMTAIVASPGSTWIVGGIGDYNGDNIADIALQNTISGQAALWTMNGSNLSPTGALLANPGTDWRMVF